MSKKKGLSMEEKCTKVLELFTGTEEPWQLKEIEKMAPKKGVIPQSVKDCVNQLVADNLIETDKIGSSTYFWAFSQKVLLANEKRVEELKATMATLRTRKVELKAVVKEQVVVEDEAEEREALDKDISKYSTRKEKAAKEVAKYKDCDPEETVKMQEQLEEAAEGAVRWTDNVFECRKWITNMSGMADSEFDQQFRIPAGFDYPED